MKVIFLDIDGVMNSQLLWEKWYAHRWFRFSFYYLNIRAKIRFVLNGFKPVIISLKELADTPPLTFKERLIRIQRQTDKLAWKFLSDLLETTDNKVCISSVWRNYFSVEEWNIVFKEYGIENSPVIGVTGGRGSCRGEEIKDWLNANPSIDKYAIIDDDSDMLPEQMSSFFQTDGYCGLSPNICYRVKNYLNK